MPPPSSSSSLEIPTTSLALIPTPTTLSSTEAKGGLPRPRPLLTFVSNRLYTYMYKYIEV